MSNFIGGWRIDREDFGALATLTDRRLLRSVRSLGDVPVEIDPRPFIKVENQGSQGSCQGNALTTVAEWCYKIATGDATLQLSRQFGYIESQRIDRLIGRDSGSTLYAGAKVATEMGLCLESLWPYPHPVRYTTQCPDRDACLRDASTRKIQTVTGLKSYQDVFDWLANGLGGVQIGITWNGSMTPRNGVVESYSGGDGGGHSVAFLGYSTRKDRSQRNYIWLANSWGATWGNGGWAEVSPSAIETMFRTRYTVMNGLSDLYGDGVQPRKPDFLKLEW